jgi:hypothetical protein
MHAAASGADSAVKANEYINEAVFGIELIQQGAALDKMLACFRAKLEPTQLQDTITKLAKGWDGFYKNYDANTDQQIFATLMPLFIKKCRRWLPNYYDERLEQYNDNVELWADNVYHVSMVADQPKFKDFVAHVSARDSSRIMSDPAWQLYTAIANLKNKQVTPVLNEYNARMSRLNRLYMAAQMKKDTAFDFYPDANLTLRLTYGKVQRVVPYGVDPGIAGAAPMKGVPELPYQTNLDGAIRKDNPDVDEFKVPEKLKALYKKKNYGMWAENGTVPLAFIASNHTSGGNSGSPVLNAKGELIGTNFDRVWEGTMSDLYYDANVCRNISLDIRYTLFIVEKMGNAGWLLNEMKINKDADKATKTTANTTKKSATK